MFRGIDDQNYRTYLYGRVIVYVVQCSNRD